MNNFLLAAGPWPIVSIIAGSVATVGILIFLLWFRLRTPSNLSRWYCIPVTIVCLAAIALLWVAVVPLLA